mmetsp:Transcript_3716/g.9480  ORF Transcript_3716/g.9480 Transcript_3716/m.9480 type:complete len:140 (+) Transcript_3716:117-536(+)
MAYSKAAVACVELGHLLVLISFMMWVPVCFQAMWLEPEPEARNYRSSTSFEVLPVRPTVSGMDHLQAAQDAERRLPIRQGTEAHRMRLVESIDVLPKTKDLPEEAPHDCGAVMTALPLLVAIVGGGAFSLEAFEAFPML